MTKKTFIKKSNPVILIIVVCTILLLLVINRKTDIKLENTITFKDKLSDYQLFEGKMAELLPSNQATIIELSSTLFTDYTEKQRLIVLPDGKKIQANGNNLPDFPDGTIIAKTFYYQNHLKKEQYTLRILETRLLIKHQSIWNAAVYQWNDRQDEAYLLKNEQTLDVSFMDSNEMLRKTKYKIPSQADCISCHRQNGQTLPLGTKIRAMNIDVNHEGQVINQLEYLRQKNKLEFAAGIRLSSLADYKNESLSTEKRARAYLDINCAHCHNPGGSAYNSNLDLRNETPDKQTGIHSKVGEIALRIASSGELHMPKIGTTIQHDEGVQLILNYLNNLK